MTAAEKMIVSLWEELTSPDDMVSFVVKGAGHGLTGTPTTRDIQSCLNAKGYRNGKEYIWKGPYNLLIKTSAIGRDLLDVLNIAGAIQNHM